MCCLVVNSLRYGLEAFMLLYSFGLSVSYMGVIGSEVNVLAQLMGGDEAISQAGWIFKSRQIAGVREHERFW